MIILTLNCGSSSVKFQVYDWERQEVLADGLVERLGEEVSPMSYQSWGKAPQKVMKACADHQTAITRIIEALTHPDYGCLENIRVIDAVGHRVVHGGETFTQSVIVDDAILDQIDAISPLAPLHNPANLTGIRAAQAILPDSIHCAIMDTAWHQSMPPSSYMYALPYAWYENYNVRRYGFHGSSYLYTAKRASLLMGKDPLQSNFVIAHIGNGASICAVKKGQSYDTSMGMTPLEGLIMGTRCGDIDPAINKHMMQQGDMTSDRIHSIFNKKSGVLGITGRFIDRRDVQKAAQQGDPRCLLAQEMETYRIRKYIGAYYAALGRLDALIFTAGVGEMSPDYRWESVKGLDALGIKMDQEKNALSCTKNVETCVSQDDSPVKIFVIPTDEELVITEDSQALAEGRYTSPKDFTYSFQNPAFRNKARERRLVEQLKKSPALARIIARPKT